MKEPFNPQELLEANWVQIPDCILILEIDASVKLVYGQLMRRAQGKSYCWPYVKSIANDLCLSERTVERAISKLEELGLLRVESPEERSSWPYTAQATVETKGNRYHFEEPPFWKEKKNHTEGRKSKAKKEQTTRQFDGSDPSKSRMAPVNLSGDGRQVVGSLLKRLNEEINEDTTKTTSPSGTYPLDRERSQEREGLATQPPRPELKQKDAPTAEVDALEIAKSSPGSLNASQTSFDLDAAVAASKASLRLQRAHQQSQQAMEKTQETRARKLAQRDRRNQQRAEAMRDQEPVEDKGKTPLGHLAQVWFSELAEVFGSMRIPLPTQWDGKEYGYAKSLLGKYNQDPIVLGDAISYLIRNWEAIYTQKYKTPPPDPIPSIGFLAGFHSAIVPKAGLWVKYRTVIEDYDAYGDDYAERPYDLQERYDEARKALSGLKLDKVKR